MSLGFARYRAVASAIIAAMANDAVAKGDHFVLLLIPSPTDQSDDFRQMLRAATDHVPGTCFVDPTDEINKTRAMLSSPADMVSETGHFSAPGDAALARALVKGLADCGIHP